MAPQTTSPPATLDNLEARLDATIARMDADPEYAAELTGPKQGNPITLGEPVIPAEEWADKQVKRASAAAADWEKNVLRPRRDPLKAAIAAAPKRAEKVRQALEEKKWEKAMGKVDEELMYDTIRKRGQSSFRSGIEDRKAKVVARAKELQPLVVALKKEIQAMPDVTDADREARMLAGRRGMIAIGKKRRGI